jgi:hypothetical protein
MTFLRPISATLVYACFVYACLTSLAFSDPRSTDDADIILEGLTTSAAKIRDFQEDYGAGYPSGSIFSKDGNLLVSWPTNSGKHVIGEASIIGSFSKPQSSWVWAWDNKTVPDSFSEISFSIKDFSETHSIDAFLKSPQVANLPYAEKLASIAILFDDYEVIFAQERRGTIIFVAVKNIAWESS